MLNIYHNFNRSSDEEFITGTYLGYQKDKKSPAVEWYYLAQVITSTPVTTKRYTVGSRIEGNVWEQIGWELEFPYQFGETSGRDIKAYAVSASLWKQFEETIWKPRVLLEYNQASGDKDPNDSVSNTFNPLYQSTHDPYGLLDFFRWQNMREVALSVAVSPNKKLKLTPQINFFWLDSKFDSWVNSSGTAVRSKTSGDRGYYVGSEASLRAYYEFSKNAKLETGYAHFFSGGYVKDSGANDDTDWFYSQLTLRY